MENPLQRTENLYVKLGLVVIGAIVFLGVGIWVGTHAFHKWQGHRFTRQAAAFAERGNDVMAATAAARAYALNPGDVAAMRVMATIAERNNQISAVEWRRRICDLDHSTGELLAYAKTAMRFAQADIAEKALDRIPPGSRSSAAYHAATGQLAVLRNNPVKADERYAEALALDPQNTDYQLSRAVVDLRLLDKRAAGRETLRSFFSHPSLGLQARRALLVDDFSVFDWDAALPVARDLAALPNAIFNDRLVYLDVLRRSGSEDFEKYLAELQASAPAKADDVAALVIWMMENKRAADAITWTAKLRAETKAQPNVKAAQALCHLALEDWPALEAILGTGNWAAWEYLRLALLARVLKQHENRDLFGTTWNDAVAAASKQPGALQQLLRLATTWGWTTELREIYWALSETDPTKESLLWLYRSYAQDKNTAGLLRVTAKLAQANPDDDRTKNNLVLFAMLSGQGTASDFQTARELFEKHPADPVFTSTYAYSLFVQKRLDEALRTMRTLAPEQLEEPSIAAYYGVFLAAKGEKPEATKFLALAEPASLMPEEKALLREAKERLK